MPRALLAARTVAGAESSPVSSRAWARARARARVRVRGRGRGRGSRGG